MNFDRMRALLLEQAIRGELVPQLDSEGVVEQVGDAPEEIPFEIPEKWKWYFIGAVLEYGRTTQVSSEEIKQDTWVLDLEDVEKGTGRLINKKRGTATTSNKAKFEKGDVLYGKLRPYLNKVLIADESGVCTTEIVPINVAKAKVALDSGYLKSYLMSPFFLDYANKISYGVKMPRLGTKDAKVALIPIPPIEEQKRIVAKLEKVFAEIDRAEKAYQELQTLSDALTKQILQKAIQGRLVPQLESEPDVVQIGEVPMDVPFCIPKKWKWVDFRKVVQTISTRNYQVKSKDIQEIGSYPVVSQSKMNLVDGYCDDNQRLVPEKVLPLLVFGDHTRVLKYIDFRFIVGADGTKLIRPNNDAILDCKYLYFALQALLHETRERGYSRHFQFVKILPMPIPPIEEQYRIVQKLESLLSKLMN